MSRYSATKMNITNGITYIIMDWNFILLEISDFAIKKSVIGKNKIETAFDSNDAMNTIKDSLIFLKTR